MPQTATRSSKLISAAKRIRRRVPRKKPVSVWLRTAKPFPFPALKRDIQADVCVVGGGIAGLTCAYLVGRAGKSVVVLEKRAIGEGETGNTTAHLSNVLDRSYREIEKLHGSEGAALAAE